MATQPSPNRSWTVAWLTPETRNYLKDLSRVYLIQIVIATLSQ